MDEQASLKAIQSKYEALRAGMNEAVRRRWASLLEKPSRARTKIDIDYKGFVIDDVFVVGYGLDFAEKYRNLPFIGRMKGK